MLVVLRCLMFGWRTVIFPLSGSAVVVPALLPRESSGGELRRGKPIGGLYTACMTLYDTINNSNPALHEPKRNLRPL